MPETAADGIHPRVLAHLGDAVYELLVREKALASGLSRLEDIHRYTTERVSGAFQARLLGVLEPELTDAEKALVRRGRNLPAGANRRSDQKIHRQATGFEALIGFLYLHDRPRLEALHQKLLPFLVDCS